MKVAVVGNLANIGYRIVKFLRKKGIEADLYLHPNDADPAWEDDTDIDKEWLKTYGDEPLSYRLSTVRPRVGRTFGYVISELSLLGKLRQYDIVQKVCGGWDSLGLSYFRFLNKPYAALATGSDLRELAIQDSRADRMTLASFRKARVLFLATPDLVNTAKELGLSNWVYLPHIIDTEKYFPQAHHLSEPEFDLVIFHPSRLDWSYSGPDRVLEALKYNDRFFRAFARYLKQGQNSLAIVVDWGIDAEKTKSLVKELGIENNIRFVPLMPKSTLIDYYNSADIVADQFGVPGLGLIALETMSCSKPVMAHVNNEYADMSYLEKPPVLNCNTEDEIYQQLLKASNKEYREQVGRQAREWVLKYHHWEKAIDKLIFHYETILGRKVARQ